MTSTTSDRIKALIEVTLVFSLMLTTLWLLQFAPFVLIAQQLFHHRFVEYLVIITLALLAVSVGRRDFETYGLTRGNWSGTWRAIGLGLLPAAVISLALNRFYWMAWPGSVTIAAIVLIALLVTAWLLRDRPEASLAGGAAAALILLPALQQPLTPGGRLILNFIFYFFFVGPGEEMFYRGYIQSRLNVVFGKPFRWMGVRWGWGLLLASVLFGLVHVFNTFNPFLGRFGLAWPWGLWTFFLGLLLGYVREKTGSVFAPAVLHGVINFL